MNVQWNFWGLFLCSCLHTISTLIYWIFVPFLVLWIRGGLFSHLLKIAVSNLMFLFFFWILGTSLIERISRSANKINLVPFFLILNHPCDHTRSWVGHVWIGFGFFLQVMVGLPYEMI